MRHARHDQALQIIERAARVVPAGQKYIVIVYDGPDVSVREASFVSNVATEDVVQVCHAVADQLKTQQN